MLILSRRVGEEIVIGGNIRVVVVGGKGKAVRLGVSAPPSVRVDRGEIAERRRRFPEGHEGPAVPSAPSET
jgi:carbon storage regulator